MLKNHLFYRNFDWNCFCKYLLMIVMIIGCLYLNNIDSFATEVDSTSETVESTVENTEVSTENESVEVESTEAGSTTEFKSSVDQARDDALSASRKKQHAQKILNKLKSAKDNLELYIIELDKSLNELSIEKNHLEKNQKELSMSIKETKKSLALAQKAQSAQYEAMKQRIQMVYESGNQQYMDVLLSATSMTDILNKTEYAYQVSMYDYNILKELKVAKEQVANLKMKLEKDLETNEVLQKELKEQTETIEIILAEKHQQVSEYQASIEGQQAEIDKYTRAKAEAEAIIAAAEQTASSSGPYTGGAFVWPVPSCMQISSPYGERVSPVPGASSFHRGIDIPCSVGASIVAAANGTVIVATHNYAEGNYIVLDHGGGVCTVYMHNSSLLVSVGQTVKAGEGIALGGSSGISSGPHCHFGVRVNGSYVDPMGYLQ